MTMGEQAAMAGSSALRAAAACYSPPRWYPERLLVAPGLAVDYLDRSGLVLIAAGRMTILLGERFVSRAAAYRAAEAFCRKQGLLRARH